MIDPGVRIIGILAMPFLGWLVGRLPRRRVSAVLIALSVPAALAVIVLVSAIAYAHEIVLLAIFFESLYASAFWLFGVGAGRVERRIRRL